MTRSGAMRQLQRGEAVVAERAARAFDLGQPVGIEHDAARSRCEALAAMAAAMISPCARRLSRFASISQAWYWLR